MTTFNTGNPIPSVAPKDLFDNAQAFDEGMNSGADTFTNRVGQQQYTWARFNRLTADAVARIDTIVGNVNAYGASGRAKIDQSVASVDQAEAAAKVAMALAVSQLSDDLGNKGFDTYAQMLAYVPKYDGTLAWVRSDADELLNGFYQWRAGSSTWVKPYPQPALSTQIDAITALIKPSQASNHPHTFEDAYGFLMAWITKECMLNIEGGVDMSSGQVTQSSSGIEFTDSNNFVMGRLGSRDSYLGGLNWRNSQAPGVEIVDEAGFIMGRFDNTPPAANPTAILTVTPELGRQQRTQIMHVIGYGQSLSRGINSIPAISTTQPYNNLMIASGTKVRNSEAGYNASSFVPLVEATAGSEGETPVTGLCNGLVRRAIADGEAASDWTFLGSSPGRSAYSVEQLGPSADQLSYYNKMVRHVQDCKSLADASGKTYSIWAYTWDQGESNYVGSYTRSPYQYTQLMLSLFDTLTKQVVGITGQEFQPYIFSYQVGGHRFYSVDKNTVALAQWRISRERSDFVVAVPVYAIPVVTGDVHLTNEGSWLLGEYRSRAMYHTMIRRCGKWRPLEPVAVEWKDDHIDVRFYAPKGPLVLDAALCALAPNFGFDVRESDAVVDIVTSVAVIADDTVRINISRPANAGAVLSYARGRQGDPVASGPVQGARGNLRDSHGLFDTAVSPLGNTFALHNPCVMFQYSRATGF
jgi:hypothetical protein